MTSLLSTAICFAIILYLFWLEASRAREFSLAIWIPIAWMFFNGSRAPSNWLGSSKSWEVANAEGEPIDALVFSILIAAAVYVLAHRQVEWRKLISQNRWIAAYMLYCLASAIWADEPLTVMKRCVREVGNPLMVLVILTDRYPVRATGAVLRSFAYLILPLSVLFIKYYPALGRTYRGDGSPMFNGVATQKNQLGLSCLIVFVYLIWDYFREAGKDKSNAIFTRNHLIVSIAIGAMTVWLLKTSDSSTAILCAAIATAIIAVGRVPALRNNGMALTSVVLGAGAFLVAVDVLFDARRTLIQAMGKSADLTGRSEIWEIVSRYEVNPFVGAGYLSFWSGERAVQIWNEIGVVLSQAHSGYMELYLNLGYVGVALIVMIMLSGLWNASTYVSEDPGYATFRITLILVAAVYNYSEAAFFGMTNMWLMLLLACMQPPPAVSSREVKAPDLLETTGLARAGLMRQAREGQPQRATLRRNSGGLGILRRGIR